MSQVLSPFSPGELAAFKSSKEVIEVSSDESSDDWFVLEVNCSKVENGGADKDFSRDEIGDGLEGAPPKKDLKNASQYDPDNMLTLHDELQIILDSHRENSYFPFKYLIDFLYKNGWAKKPVPKQVKIYQLLYYI
jgi:hypothetical protein